MFTECLLFYNPFVPDFHEKLLLIEALLVIIYFFMLMHLAKAGPCQLMFAETLHVASPGVFGKRPSVFSCG